MKSTLPVALLAGSIAGIVGSLAVRSLSSAPVAQHEPAAVAPGASPEELAAALRELSASLAGVHERLDALESQARLVAARRETAVADELALASAGGAREQAEKLTAALGEQGVALSDDLQASVRSALERIRDEEEKERADRRREQLEQRLDERIAELALELGLTRGQQDQLRNLYLDTDTRRNELFSALRDGGGDWGSVRDQMRDLRDGVEQQLAKTLTPDQLEKFKETDTGRMLYGPGGGGPGGGGFFGGGNRRNREAGPTGG